MYAVVRLRLIRVLSETQNPNRFGQGYDMYSARMIKPDYYQSYAARESCRCPLS
jgi:hypothetical protein